MRYFASLVNNLSVFLSSEFRRVTILIGGGVVELIYSNNYELVGNSEAINNISRAIKLLEGRDFRVALVSGEIGTQKKTVAGILHHHSARRNRPLTNIDCMTSAPWIEGVVDAEGNTSLFGDNEGILCLQNIETLSLKTQGNFLRHLEQSLQSGRGNSLIALTTADLKKAVKEGRFLLEFYEFLSRFHLHMPPLRERIGDIAPLSKKMLKESSTTFHTKMTQVEPEVLDICSKYNWPGNIRELKGMLEQVVLHYPNESTFRVDFIPHYLNSGSASKVIQVAADMKLPRQGVVLEELERSLLKQALEQMLGNQSRAARLLGISRFALRYRMEKYGLFPKTKEEIMAAANDKWSE
jgi:two-component system NtrC family response regulator